jgi:hypothetical protein
MLETDSSTAAGEAIKAASALTETTFLHVGRNCTMANERRVHDQVLGRSSPVPMRAATVVPAELDDVLFQPPRLRSPLGRAG